MLFGHIVDKLSKQCTGTCIENRKCLRCTKKNTVKRQRKMELSLLDWLPSYNMRRTSFIARQL